MNSAAASNLAPCESRHQPRTHLFVAATLYAEGGSTPVNIRNMSVSGALLEGAVLPDVGFRIALKRGPLQVTGHIAWRTHNRAGVRLDAAVHIADWMARQGSAGQDRVDAMLSVIRSGDSREAAPRPPLPGNSSIDTELRQLRRELMELEEALVKDVVVVATHSEVQVIDLAVQRIDRMLRTVGPGA